MPGKETLRLLPPEIADRIRRARDERRLRQLALECARLAFGVVPHVTELAVRAFEKLEALARGEASTDAAVRALRDELSGAVEALDNVAFDVQDRAEHGAATKDDYLRAFSIARATASLAAAIGDKPEAAAAEACYEAIAASDVPDKFSELAKSILDKA